MVFAIKYCRMIFKYRMIFRCWTLDPAGLNVTLIFIQTSQSQCTHVTFLFTSLRYFEFYLNVTLHVISLFFHNFLCSKWRLLPKHLLAALNLPLGTTSLYNYFMNYLLIISSPMNVSGQRFIKCMLFSSLFFFVTTRVQVLSKCLPVSITHLLYLFVDISF